MRPNRPPHLVWFAPLLLLVACEDDSDISDFDPERFEGLWRGEYTIAANPPAGPRLGTALIDVTMDGATGGGRVVLRDLESPDAVPMSVTADVDREDEEIRLETVSGSYRFDLGLLDDDRLGGTFRTPLEGNGTISLHRVDDPVLQAVPFLSLPDDGVLSMAHDGERLWLSTTGNDYVRVDPAGAVVDTVAVFYFGDAHWTSSILAFGHDRMWGAIPSGSTTGPTVSRILPFNTGGILFDGSFHLPHIASGLAHDGEDLWSLSDEKLFRVSETGAVLDSLNLWSTDLLVHLELDGNRFLAVGWYIPRLYVFDAEGRLLNVYRLPPEGGAVRFPGGLTVIGEDVYYARSLPGQGTEIFRLSRPSPAAGRRSSS